MTIARTIELLLAQAPAAGATTRQREDIDPAYKWDLSDIYTSWDLWERDLELLRELMERYVGYDGRLSEGAQVLLEALRLSDELSQVAFKLYRFPQLSYDLDQRDNATQAKLQEVQGIFAEFRARTAWFEPAVVQLGQEQVAGWIDAVEGLAVYRFTLMEIFRSQEHLLDETGERLLAYGSRFGASPAEIYRALSTADIDFPTIELADGTSLRVTYAEYRRMLDVHPVQEDRASASAAIHGWFDSKRNTYATIYNGVCQRDWARAQSRRFSGCAEAALHTDNVPVEVLENLIATTRKSVAGLQGYHALRKETLGLEHYHLHDARVPLVDDPKSYTYDEACEVVLESAAPLGEEYVTKLQRALQEGWLDVFEVEGKRSGAYSAGVYGVHPYMLLNYSETLSDVFTLTHELGHTLHTLFSHESQPYATAFYTIFVAEVASTLNEALLLDHLLKKTDDAHERVRLLSHAIQGILGTYYTQVMFADFELRAHRAAESGQPMTAESLSAIYREGLEAFYGDSVELTDYSDIGWARIPHFFGSPFYVYQYATSFAASSQIAVKILRGDTDALTAYLDLLRAGGNDHPIDQLKRAGVDLTQPEPIEAVAQRLDALVAELRDALAALD